MGFFNTIIAILSGKGRGHDVDELARRLGLDRSSPLRIRFNQYDSKSIPADGIAIDNVMVTGSTAGDLRVSPMTRWESFWD